VKIVAYVSGHGYGHAVRSAEVLRHLAGASIRLRTTAPERFFEGFQVERAEIDPGMCELAGGLEVDAEATRRTVESFLERREEIVAQETAAARGARLILADVPWLAADIAERLGVPCIAFSNFTWDWIYEPFLRDVEPIRASYRKVSLFLHVPLGPPCPNLFPRVEEMPLIARRPARTREETMRALGIAPGDRRIRVLIGMRGGVPALPEIPGCLILTPDAPLPFADLLAASDMVVSKIGYGTVAEAIAARTRLLHVPRTGFREVETAREQAAPYLPMLEIGRADFEAGRWGEAIRALAAAPLPRERPPVDGAARIARRILM